MPTPRHLAALAVATGLTAAALTGCSDSSTSTTPAGDPTATVQRVVNATTLVVRTQANRTMTVGLLGVAAPAPGECWGSQALDATNGFVAPGSPVVVTTDPSPGLPATDNQDRVLAYVTVPAGDYRTPVADRKLGTSQEILNVALLRAGDARHVDYPNADYKYRQQFIGAESMAQIRHQGMWAACPQTIPS